MGERGEHDQRVGLTIKLPRSVAVVAMVIAVAVGSVWPLGGQATVGQNSVEVGDQIGRVQVQPPGQLDERFDAQPRGQRAGPEVMQLVGVDAQ